MNPSTPPRIQILPEDAAGLPPAPYANASFAFATMTDITVVFMRVPNMTQDDFAKASKAGQAPGQVVSTITVPIKQAKELADALKGLIAEIPQ